MAFHQQIPNGTIRGHIRVLEKTDLKEGKYPLYKCECVFCNRIFQKNSNALSPTKDHYCLECEESKNLKTHFKDLSNQIFGDYKVIQRIKKPKDKKVFWECECLKCGEKVVQQAGFIKKGIYCRKNKIKSYGEEEIAKILLDNNIPFIREQNFEPSLNEDEYSRHMKFDFYVNHEYVIEFDGIQHFECINFFGDKETFKRNQEVAQIKNNYCLQHGIPIIRIPYWKRGKIELNDLLPQYSQFLV